MTPNEYDLKLTQIMFPDQTTAATKTDLLHALSAYPENLPEMYRLPEMSVYDIKLKSRMIIY